MRKAVVPKTLRKVSYVASQAKNPLGAAAYHGVGDQSQLRSGVVRRSVGPLRHLSFGMETVPSSTALLAPQSAAATAR